jgi:hypothetical protein
MPRLRIPLWAAVSIPAAAYAIRSMVRGSFTPDLPEDAIVAAILVALLSLAALRRRTAHERGDELRAKMHGGDDPERSER